MRVKKHPIPVLLLVGSMTVMSVASGCSSSRTRQLRDQQEPRTGLEGVATRARETSAPVSSDEAPDQTLQQAPASASGEALSQPGARRGMTWGKARHDPELGIDLVGCYGRPTPDGSRGCDAYRGDTLCTETRPILCVKKDGSSRPPYAVTGTGHSLTKEFYRGWAEGEIGLTGPVRGAELLSYENASSICAAELGPGFRMAQHHDSRWVVGMSEHEHHTHTWPGSPNTGGWSFWARGNINGQSRFWVYIADQDANCWQEDLEAQRALYRKNIDEIRDNLSWHNPPDRDDS